MGAELPAGAGMGLAHGKASVLCHCVPAAYGQTGQCSFFFHTIQIESGSTINQISEQTKVNCVHRAEQATD